LREKLKFNIGTKKRPLKRDTIENIYLSNSASINDFKKLSKTNIATQNAAKNPNPNKKANTSQNDKVAAMKSLPPNLASSSKQDISNVIDKKRSNTFKSVTAKSKGKNFILENKLKIKKISSANKLQTDDADSQDTPRDVCNMTIGASYTFFSA